MHSKQRKFQKSRARRAGNSYKFWIRILCDSAVRFFVGAEASRVRLNRHPKKAGGKPDHDRDCDAQGHDYFSFTKHVCLYLFDTKLYVQVGNVLIQLDEPGFPWSETSYLVTQPERVFSHPLMHSQQRRFSLSKKTK
jgi:hypothetical protein